jgi:DNA-binding Lrp family transcriptional regulator
MSELANDVSISVSGLTRVVERLSRQGLVERVKADTDGRGQLAVLTPAGFARLEQAYPIHLAGVRKHVMDHLAGLDLPAFAEAMSGIAAAEMGPPIRRTTPASPGLRNGHRLETPRPGAADDPAMPARHHAG